MAFDQHIEIFACELFNRLWLDYGLIDTPLILKGTIEPIEPVLTEDMVQAVKVRQTLFRSSYQAFFDSTYLDFKASASDFYAYLVDNFPRLGFANDSAMEKVLTACAFVAEMCQYACSRENNFFVPLSYLICAMFIDQWLSSDFYAEGGWWTLIRTCQYYISPFAFIKQHSKTITSSYGKNSFSFCASDCRMGLDSLERFSNLTAPKSSSMTMLWVDYCIEDLERSTSQPKGFIASTNLEEEAVNVLNKLKLFCDPTRSKVKLYDDVFNFAVRCGRQPTHLLQAFCWFRPFDEISGPNLPTAEILALKRRITDLIKPDSSPANENRSYDNQKYEEVLALFSELHNKKKGRRAVGMESLKEDLKRSLHPSSFPPNDLQISNVSFYDGTIRNTSSDSVKSMAVGNENFNSNAPTSKEAFLLKTSKESPGSQKAFENKKDKDLATDFLSQLEVNSPKGVRISSSYSRSSGVMKNRRSVGKENSPSIQTSEKLHSPKIFNESLGTPESRMDKIDKDQATGSLSQLDMNSFPPDGVNISLNYSRSSGVVNKRKSGGKENSRNIQASEKPYSRKKSSRSPQSQKENSPNIQASEKPYSRKKSSRSSQSQKDKEEKDQITGLLSKLNSLLPDDLKTSPSHSQNSGSITKRKSEGKEKPPSNIQISKNCLLPGKIINESSSTVKTSEGKKDKGIGLISNLYNDSFLTDGTYFSSSHSRNSDTSREGSEVKEVSSSKQKIEEQLLQEHKLINSLNTKIQWLLNALNSKQKDQTTNESINSLCRAYLREQSSSSSISAQAEKEKLTDEVINGISSTDHINSPESLAVFLSKSPTDSHPHSTLNTSVSRVIQILRELKHKETDDTGRYDMATVIKDSSHLPGATNTISIKKSSDQKMVTEDCLNKTRTKVLSRSSSKTSDIDSVVESNELERVEDCLKTTPSSTSSRNPSRSRLPNASEEKSKTSRESTLTRRQQLLKTEEHAKDVLRMIHVLGNKISLENIKSTLKNQ